MPAHFSRSTGRERQAEQNTEQRKGGGAGEGDLQIGKSEMFGPAPSKRQVQQTRGAGDPEAPAQLLRHAGDAARRAHFWMLDVGVNNGLRRRKLERLEKAGNQQKHEYQ